MTDPDRPLREPAIPATVPAAWTLGEVAAAIGAVATGDPDLELGKARIDTRLIEPGNLFVAMRGTRTHGAKHAEDAVDAGATAILVGSDADPEDVAAAAKRLAVLQVNVDSLLGLGRLARAWRRFNKFTVVGITGSSGKTSTKDLLAQVLSHLRVHASRENNNNEIGVPLTLLEAPADTQAVILEMGMRGTGQIDYLCSIAEPDIGIVTNAGLAHIELLGTREAIVSAKAELIGSLPPDGVAIVPAAQPELLAAALTQPAQIRQAAADSPVLDGWLLASDSEHQRTNLSAALEAAFAVAQRLGVPLPTASLEPLTVSKGRGEQIERGDGVVVLDDSYNANPDSMRAALKQLARTEGKRRIAVLGLMAELGDFGPREHRDLGRFIADQIKPDIVILVGDSDLMENLAGALRPIEPRRVLLPSSAAAILEDVLEPGDVVLVKASRSVGLEGVVHTVLESTPAVEGPRT